jgi:hypothetical protein
VARRSADWGSLGLALLGLAVAALLGSWAWTRFAPARRARAAPATARIVRVQVLNGSGEPGMGTRVASYLREGGFRVVDVRNADRSDYFASMVVARGGDLSLAREVAHYLGGPPLVRQRWDSELADVSVLIGSDRSRLRLEP